MTSFPPDYPSRLRTRFFLHIDNVPFLVTGDFRVALSVAACGFILFGLVAFLAGLGKRPAAEKEAAA